ncbi:hypothetical protein UKKV901664_12230 [Klebsiella pneumoniae subsp. pneumoniae UKKV901664]|nr:hypothetical protein UKKV901664_12230 [Klebsiella pneumoniae subsp. pneumoniae UKKV901664]
MRIPAARASAKAAAICCWNSPFSASPPTAGCEKRRKQPEVVKLRYGDIKKKLSGDRVRVGFFTSSASDVSISSSKNDKDIKNNYHLYFGWLT